MSVGLQAWVSIARRRVLSREALASESAPVVAIALVSFVAHLLVAGNYGYFRDQLYYMDAGRHFQTGYVDFPPFIAWLAGVLRIVGDNLVVLNATTALAGACLIVVTGLMARELGGGRGAQALAAMGSAVALVFVATAGIYTMDAFDELWWALAAYVFIRLVRRDEPRLWLVFGLVAGIGLFTKLSMLFFGFALVLGLLLTPGRRVFRTRWPWLGGAIALAFLLPYIAWQAQNGWPTPEFWHNYGGIESGSSPLDFLLSQIFTLNPLNVPLWIAGLVWYFGPAGKPYRALGWAYVILYALFTLTHAKSYFLAPAYPMLFAAGAVQLEGAFQRRGWSGAARGYLVALALSGVFFAPGVLPVLPPATYGHLYGWIGAASGAKQGEGNTPLPQLLADRFGWPEQTDAVAAVYHALPAADRAQACIVTSNYGEAAGLNFFGPAHGLPRALSGHNTYYLWGYGGCTGQVVITLGFSSADVHFFFGSVTAAAMIRCANCAQEESDLTIYVCRQPRVPMAALWREARHFN
jgi:4-amino-4-deoxy-L-arabinose transferase-like glycosyltransferase